MSADEEEQQILEEILQENDSEDEFLQEYEKVSKQPVTNRLSDIKIHLDSLPNEISFKDLKSEPSSPQFSRFNGDLLDSETSSRHEDGSISSFSSIDNLHEIANQSSISDYSQVDNKAFFDTFESIPSTQLETRNDHILGCRSMDQISAYLNRPKTKETMGIATTLIATSSRIVIATSRGFVLIFTLKEKLKSAFGNQDYGAVTAVDINDSWLVLGYETGDIVLVDIETQKPIKSVKQHHAPIVGLRFLSDKTRFISCDSKGVMYSFVVSKVLLMNVIEGQLLLNGKVGQIYSLSPLLQPLQYFEALTLIAFGTSSKIHIMTSYQNVSKIIHSISKPKEVISNFPALSWRPPALGPPILALGWGKFVSLLQVEEKKKQLSFQNLLKYTLETEVVALGWVALKVFVILDSKNQLQVFDCHLKKVVEAMPAGNLELVFHNKFSASQFCYHGSFYSIPKGLVLLGMKNIYFAYLLTWEERLQYLTSENHWKDALLLAQDFLQGKSTITSGLSKEPQKRQRLIMDKIIAIIYSYITYVETQYPPNVPSNDIYYKTLGETCIDCCLTTVQTDILFSEIFDKFVQFKKKDFFLELLEPFILKNRLKILPPEIMQQFIEYFSETNKLKRVEDCILHLDITNIDFHQVATLCKKHRLFNAYIYLYTEGIGDFISPLTEILNAIPTVSIQERSHLTDLAISYISNCLRGKSLSSKPLRPQITSSLNKQIIQFLLPDKPKDANEPYPHLKQLILLKPFEFLEELFQDLNSISSSLSIQQTFVDAVLYIINGPKKKDLTELQIEAGFIFVAKNIIIGSATVSKENQDVLIKKLTLGSPQTIKIRQETMLGFVKYLHQTPNADYDLESLIITAEGAELYRVAEYLYREKGNYFKVIVCHLKDPSLKANVFELIKDFMESKTLSPEYKVQVKSATLSHLRDLITIDGPSTSRLIIECFTDDHERVLKELDAYPELQFRYLQNFMVKDKKSGMRELLQKNSINITSEVQQKYIRLMCQYDPKSVYKYLTTHDDYPLEVCLKLCQAAGIKDAIIYLLERTGDFSGALDELLKIAQAKLNDLMKSYETNVQEVEEVDQDKPFPRTKKEKELNDAINKCIELCRRNSQRLEEGEIESLWFKTIGIVIDPLRKLRQEIKNTRKSAFQDKVEHALTFYMQIILHSMTGYVKLPSILSKIVTHGDTFGDFRFVILGMLETYTFEQTILQTASRLVEKDKWMGAKDLNRKRRKGIRPRSWFCLICKASLMGNSALKRNNPSGNLIFYCGHQYHKECLPISEHKKPICPLCLGEGQFSSLKKEKPNQK